MACRVCWRRAPVERVAGPSPGPSSGTRSHTETTRAGGCRSEADGPSPPSYVTDWMRDHQCGRTTPWCRGMACLNTAPWKHGRGALVFLELAFRLVMTVVWPVLLGFVKRSWRARQQEIHWAGRCLGIDGFFSLRRRDLECERGRRRAARALRPPPRSARAYDICWGCCFVLHQDRQWLAGTNPDDPQDTKKQRGRRRTSALVDISLPWHCSPSLPTSIVDFASDACAFHCPWRCGRSRSRPLPAIRCVSNYASNPGRSRV